MVRDVNGDTIWRAKGDDETESQETVYAGYDILKERFAICTSHGMPLNEEKLL